MKLKYTLIYNVKTFVITTAVILKRLNSLEHLAGTETHPMCGGLSDPVLCITINVCVSLSEEDKFPFFKHLCMYMKYLYNLKLSLNIDCI